MLFSKRSSLSDTHSEAGKHPVPPAGPRGRRPDGVEAPLPTTRNTNAQARARSNSGSVRPKRGFGASLPHPRAGGREDGAPYNP